MGPLGPAYTTECKNLAFKRGYTEPVLGDPRLRVDPACTTLGRLSPCRPRGGSGPENSKASDKCRMRLFCLTMPPPRVRHLLAHFLIVGGPLAAPGAPS